MITQGYNTIKRKIVNCVQGLISPLIANIVLNHLDWQLDAQGYKFVRYADDFVVMCKSMPQAEEALGFVKTILEQELGLNLNSEKTKITRFSKGFEFLGFFISSHSVRMRSKSEENFKTKVRKLTKRLHNLDATLIEKLN